MIIKNQNIDDFNTMITTCFLNGIKDIRVFVSEKNNDNDNNDIINITYVLFTPLYTAIYNDSVNKTNAENIYNKLIFTQENNCNHGFRIQIFDKLSFNESINQLTIGKETNII